MPQGGVDKKIIILGVLIFVFVVALIIYLVIGRSKKQEETSVRQNELVIWDSFDSEENLTPYFAKFEEANPDIEIKYVKKNPQNYELESIEAIASENPPDIWVVPSNWMGKHNDKLAALSEGKMDSKNNKTNAEVFQETFISVASQDSVLNDQVLGMPLFVDTLSLYYNGTLLNQKYQDYIKSHENVDPASVSKTLTTPPKTWDDLNNLIKLYGSGAIALGNSSVENSADILSTLMIQYGTQMVSDDKKTALFHTAKNQLNDVAYPGTKALEFYTGFAKKGKENFTYDGKSAYNDFTSEKVAMMIDYRQNLGKIKADMTNEPSVAVLPQPKNIARPIDLAYYQIFTVTKQSQNQEMAWNFILSLQNSDLSQKYLTKLGVNSPYKSQVEGSNDPFDIQTKNATSWYNPDPAKVVKIFNSAIDQVLGGQKAQTAIDGAAAEVTTLL